MTTGDGGTRLKETSVIHRKGDDSPEEGNHQDGDEEICQRRAVETHPIASEGNHQIEGSTTGAATTDEALIDETTNVMTIESLTTSDENREHLKSDANDRGAMRGNASHPVENDHDHLVAIRKLKRRNTEIHRRQSKN